MSFKLKFEGLDGNTHRKCNRNIEEYFSQKEQQEWGLEAKAFAVFIN